VKPYPQLLRIFMALDVGRLREIQSGAFTTVSSLDGTIIQSSVNGSSFQVEYDMTNLSPIEIVTLAQMALDAKVRGFCRPITRSVALFN
jgi:hypothetical protein